MDYILVLCILETQRRYHALKLQSTTDLQIFLLIDPYTKRIKYKNWPLYFNPLNVKLNPICLLLALLGAHHILHDSGIRVNGNQVCLFRTGRVGLCKEVLRFTEWRKLSYVRWGSLQNCTSVFMYIVHLLCRFQRVKPSWCICIPNDVTLWKTAVFQHRAHIYKNLTFLATNSDYLHSPLAE